MRLPLFWLLVALGSPALTAVGAPLHSTPRSWDERRIALPLVGSGAAYVPHVPTAHVVIFISGDAGWNAEMVEMARRLAPAAIVIGISYPALRRRADRDGDDGCWYVAADLELISHAGQKALELPQYSPPVLVGYGSGGSLVYTALAGAPAVTFAGGLSLAFCPDLHVAREVCAGDDWQPDYHERQRVNELPPTKRLPKEWYILQGVQDRVCSIDAVRKMTRSMSRTHLLPIDATGHSLSTSAQWEVPFDQAIRDLWVAREAPPPSAEPRTATTSQLESGLTQLQLPLEFRWPARPTALLLFFSGDGGWASLDEDTAEHLVSQDIGVIGVSSLRYFWNTKTPATVAADIGRVVMAVSKSGKPIFVGGFSFGADIVPVALATMSGAERRAIAGLILIGASPSASFEINPLDWVRQPPDNPKTHVAPAIRALGLPTLCLAGLTEEDTPCPSLTGTRLVRVARLPGSHHFNGDYQAVAQTIVQFIQQTTGPRP